MWQRAVISVNSTQTEDEVAALVWSLGASGIEKRDGQTFSEFSDSLFSRSTGTEATLIAYFPPDVDLSQLEDALTQWIGVQLIETASFDEGKWRASWRQYFNPTRLSKRVTVRPSWDEKLPDGEHEVVVVIDPSMAFGTGTHATTRMCVEEIDSFLTRQPNSRFLDVGCGTGILTFCALKLGATNCRGIDIDPQAVTIAVDNYVKNGLGEVQTAPFSTMTLGEITGAFDLVVANMLSGILFEIRDDLIRVIGTGGRLVISGVVDSEDFLPRFLGDELIVQEQRQREEWLAWRMVKK